VRVERAERRVYRFLEDFGRVTGLRRQRLERFERDADERLHVDWRCVAALDAPHDRRPQLAMKVGLPAGRNRSDVCGSERREHIVGDRRGCRQSARRSDKARRNPR
jgi:hypothetical protein